MNRRHFAMRAVAIAVLSVAFGGVAFAQTALKFSHTDQPGGARHRAAELFGQKIEQYTQGRYKLQIFPAGQLANDPKAIEQLQLGGIDFTVSSTGSFATHLASLNLTMLPYLVESYEQGWKLYDESAWLKSEFAKAPAKGGASRSPIFHRRSPERHFRSSRRPAHGRNTPRRNT